jgi:hypothetical protein
VLPGTELRVDFIAQIFERSQTWNIEIVIPNIGYRAVSPLLEWMTGEKTFDSIARLRQFRLGGEVIHFDSGRPTLFLDSVFKFSFAGENAEIRTLSPVTSGGSALDLRPIFATGDSLGSCLGERKGDPCTLFSIAEPKISTAIPLHATREVHIGFEPHRVTQYCGEAYGFKDRIRAIRFTTGEGVVQRIDHGEGSTTNPRLLLARASVLTTAGDAKRIATVAGFLPPSPHTLDFGSWAATIVGDEKRPVYLNFREDSTEPINIGATLTKLTLPMDDGSLAWVETGGVAADLVLDTGSVAQKSSLLKQVATKRECDCKPKILVGRNTFALIPLDKTTLKICRTVDLLNLSFSFKGFELRIRQSVPVLRRQQTRNKKQPWVPATVQITFPPQHTAEEWFRYQDPTTLTAEAAEASV